ncbi:MAG: hypothetical protein LBE62_16235, partial [Azonexus sp.]|nr:hypothetical protein [Azonexus sp.]
IFRTSCNNTVRLIPVPPQIPNETGQIICYKSGQITCSLQIPDPLIGGQTAKMYNSRFNA